MGGVFAPVVHRFLHRFHAEAGGTSPHRPEEQAKSRHMLWRTGSLVWISARRMHMVRTLGHGLSPSSLESPDAPDAWHARSCGR